MQWLVTSGINTLSGQPEGRYVITWFDLFISSMLVMCDTLALASLFRDVRRWLANAIFVQSSFQDYAECFFEELLINCIAFYGDFLFLRDIC